MGPVLQFLIDRFPDLLDLNLTVSIVILFIICVRQFLKRAPKIFSYVLWAIVLFRLLIPISIESPMSVVPERSEFSSMVNVNEVMPVLEFESPSNRVNNQEIRENTPSGEPFVQTSRGLNAQTYLTFVWLTGMGIMLLRSVISYLKLQRKLKLVIPLRKGIFIADDIDTPFVMGIFRPRIYLPGTLDPSERKYIIAHERHHISRGDHLFKALGYLALTIHWFNPLVWVAFVLANRDMEMSCDEAVIRKFGAHIRGDYSASLLNLATGQRMFSGNPLAFGEGNPTGRVRNLAKWKKPAIWVVILCVIVCVILAVCLLTNPEQADLEDMTLTYGPATIGVGELEFTLPQGFSIAMRTSDVQPEDDSHLYEHVIWKNDEIVGGIYKLKSSDPTLSDKWYWIESLNIPENVPEDRFMMSVEYTDFRTDASYNMAVSYGKNGTVETIHYLFIGEEIVYDIWFDMALLTDEDTKSILETIKITEPEANVPFVDWGVSIKPDRVSRTGATALFVYSGSIPGEEGAELTYGDFLSLDRWVNGAWVPCDEMTGYNYFAGDSSYPVVDGYGMVHEWQDRFGELKDGHYRLGKQVTLVRLDGSRENRMVYGEFTLPDAVQTGPIPLEELPKNYGAEQAMIDGCLVSRDGDAMENIDAFRAFYEACYRGEPGFFRTVDYYYGEDPYYVVQDINFDGSKYLLNVMDSRDQWIRSAEYRHLKYFTGEEKSEDAPYDAFECYMLVDDNNVTWGELSGQQNICRHRQVFANYIYYPKTPQLPENPAEVILEFEGRQLVTVTDFDRLEKIWILFGDAELMGYEPKTHSIGIGLNLVLKSQTGETLVIELDPDSDICRIGGEYVFYGAADEPDYIMKLWEYLGIDAWPDAVYDICENAYRP